MVFTGGWGGEQVVGEEEEGEQEEEDTVLAVAGAGAATVREILEPAGSPAVAAAELSAAQWETVRAQCRARGCGLRARQGAHEKQDGCSNLERIFSSKTPYRLHIPRQYNLHMVESIL